MFVWTLCLLAALCYLSTCMCVLFGCISALTRSRTASFLDHSPSRHPSLSESAADAEPPSPHDYQAGRAEAAGALCRIFCSHKTGETILPVYLSRFYIAMYYGLQVGEVSSKPIFYFLFLTSLKSCKKSFSRI